MKDGIVMVETSTGIRSRMEYSDDGKTWILNELEDGPTKYYVNVSGHRHKYYRFYIEEVNPKKQKRTWEK